MYDDDFQPRRSSSRKGASWLLYLIVLAVVGGGIYYAWNNAFDFTKAKKFFDNQEISSGISGVLGKTPEKVKSWKEKMDTAIKSTVAFLTEKPKEAAVNFVQDVKDSALESARKEATKVLGLPKAIVAGSPQAGGGQNAGDIPSNISIVRSVRQNLSVLIDADNEDSTYAIDWGDGKTDKGSVLQKGSKTIDHLWIETGDYIVKVDVEGKAAGKKTFSFPITIAK